MTAGANGGGVGGSGGRLEVVAAGGEAADQIDLFEGASKRRGIPGGDVYRPELGTNPTRSQPRHIGLVAVERIAGVSHLEVAPGADPKRPCQVVVAIDDRQVGMDLSSLLGKLSHLR